MHEIAIRPYQSGDRAQVRHVCFVTGYMGDPIDWQWRDAESFADMFTAYYTDREPESALVAELDGTVVGYLLGCVDSRRAPNPAALLGPHLLRRGLMFRRGTAGVLWRSTWDSARLAVRRQLPDLSLERDPRWPAHLHIDLLPVARGRGVGGELIRRWLDTLRTLDVPGCHLGTWGENASAIAFFSAMGFERRGEPAAMPGMRAPDGSRHTVVFMAQELEASRSG